MNDLWEVYATSEEDRQNNNEFERLAEERALWEHICKMSRTDLVLHDMLEQCIIYYHLRNQNGN
jgi:hypothetical protein